MLNFFSAASRLIGGLIRFSFNRFLKITRKLFSSVMHNSSGFIVFQLPFFFLWKCNLEFNKFVWESVSTKWKTENSKKKGKIVDKKSNITILKCPSGSLKDPLVKFSVRVLENVQPLSLKSNKSGRFAHTSVCEKEKMKKKEPHNTIFNQKC